MSGISSIISDVDAKVARLIRYGDTLRSQLKYQEGRTQDMMAELNDKNQKISQLEEEVSKLQAERTTPVQAGGIHVKQDTKLKINELVREIDKCIALLNR